MEILFTAAETLGYLSVLFVIGYFVVRKHFSGKEIMAAYGTVWLTATILSLFRDAFSGVVPGQYMGPLYLVMMIALIAVTFVAFKMAK